MRLKNTAIAREILHKEFGEPFFPRSVVDKVDAFLLGINIGKKSAVKHGDWILKHIGAGHYWECSVCLISPCIYVTKDTKYCPNCGAKMDGDKNVSS